MNQHEAKELLAKHGGNVTRAAEEAGLARSTFKRRLKGGGAAVKSKQAQHSASVKTLADFRSKYDKNVIIPQRIREGLKKLGAGGWEYESQFTKLAGVGIVDLGNFRDQFADFIVSIERGTRRVWAGSKRLARELQEAVE